MMDAFQAVLCCFLFYTFCSTVAADEWGYGDGADGPSHWSDEAPECAAQSQSPVDIVTNNVLIDPSLQTLEFTGYEQTLGGGTFVNNGHSIQLNFPSNKTFKLYGGGMGKNTYTALQLHFHWAAPGSNVGSEHTVNGKHYPVEMHIVHIKDPYTATSEVKDMADGLTVLGVFLDIGADENLAFQELLRVAKDCTYEGTEAPLVHGPRLFSLLPDSGSFYRYSGSLTTPPCYQAVTWTVFQDPVFISEQQLEILQSLKSSTRKEAAEDKVCDGENCEIRHKRANDADDELGGNYRPIQALNGRIVTSYLDIGFTELDESHGWTYSDRLTGTSQWSKKYTTCGKMSQSPINIDSSKTMRPTTTGSSDSLVFNGYGENLKGTFVNNGHSVQLNFDSSLNYLLTNGGLNSSYTAVQLHFHWGEAFPDGRLAAGSEHTVDSMRYPAEMHIVHGKTSELSNLNTYRETASDAYTVLGIFIQVYENKSEPNNDDGANPHYQKLFDAINEVTFTDNTTEFPSGPSLESLLPEDKSFYRYDGSLTTPPCTESVIWTVFSKPVVISVDQFIAFQRLFDVESARVAQHSTIKIKKEMTLLDGVSNNEKHKEESNTDEAASLPENAGKETLDALRSSSSESAELHLLSNGTANHLLRNNYRPLQGVNDRTVYYYDASNSTTIGEPPEDTGLPVWEIAIFVVAGIAVFIVMILIVVRCGCKKDKGTGYSAGRPGTDVVNL